MSWDVVLYNFEGNPPDINDLSGESPSMGDAQEIRDSISAVIPDVDWSDPACGVVFNDDCVIEFSHQETGQVSIIMLHVRKSKDPVSTIVKLCKTYNWSAFDTTSMEFIDLDTSCAKGWDGGQEFRDQKIDQTDLGKIFEREILLYVSIGFVVALLAVIMIIRMMI